MKSYKELEVWQKAIVLVKQVYEATRTFPPEERYGHSSQLRRAGTSIPANIAEGWGRGTTKEYIQFLRVARGSLMELETHLTIARDLNYLSEQKFQRLGCEVDSIGMMLNGLIHSLTKH